MTRRRRNCALVIALLAVVALLAGCSGSLLSGQGSLASDAPSSGPGGGSGGFPSTSAPSSDAPSAPGSATAPTAPAPGSSSIAPAVASSCPTVNYPAARITYPCITSGMTRTPSGSPPWLIQDVKTVETASGWAIDEGATGPVAGTPATLVTRARDLMVAGGGYLPNPKVATVSERSTTVGGRPGVVLESLITINPQQAATAHTKVKQERLWVVGVELVGGQTSLWHVSIPDLAQQLWAGVPKAIAAIKVS